MRQQFEFQKPSDPPSDPLSGKLVCELEGSTGYGWAVAIDGCPEVNPLPHTLYCAYMYNVMYTCKYTQYIMWIYMHNTMYILCIRTMQSAL